MYAIATFKFTATKFHCLATNTCGIDTIPAIMYVTIPILSGSRCGDIIINEVPIYPNLLDSLSRGVSFFFLTKLVSGIFFMLFIILLIILIKS